MHVDLATAPAGTTGRPASGSGTAPESGAVSARPAAADDLKNAFRSHPAGVNLITADDGSGPVAMTVTSLISVSAEPPLMAFSASALSSATPTLLQAETVVVHFLAPAQIELAKLGATSGVDRFADRSQWTRLADGTPVFHDCDFWIRTKVVNKMTAGGSTVFLLEALECADCERSAEAPALVYRNRTWHALEQHSSIG
ncbi:flavin reductase family protein [Brevibacterium daeguense]|uniref:Flavin reductase family protein n=1 Tax=Brevibacterium daeguense TaxID=909936 RepID=A0ABP8EFZ7_9MICO|nr:flavin reductase family protein [Brevibacterium daeguense]